MHIITALSGYGKMGALLAGRGSTVYATKKTVDGKQDECKPGIDGFKRLASLWSGI